MIYGILATNLSRMVSSASIGFMPAIEPLSMCALSSAENQQNWTVCQEDWVFKTSHWIPPTLVGGTHPTSKCRAKAAVPFFLPVLRRPFRRSRQRIPGTFSTSKINKSSIWIHLVHPIWRNMDELINAASRIRQTDPKNRHGMTCL